MAATRDLWPRLLLLAGLAGCHGAPAPPSGTGAKEAAQAYYEALVRREWPQAYAALHPDSRRRCPQDLFTSQAQAYRRNLGFEPTGVRVRACEERGTEAIAHVLLTGHASSQARRYKDGITLRRTGEGWQVLLPQHFGRKM
jgi:hypothetical protein